MLELKNITKIYPTRNNRKVYALKDVSLSFPSKGMCLIMGQSGSGKTTMLNIIGGLDLGFEGEYTFLDKKLTTEKDFADFRRNYVSLIFQEFNLIGDLTVEENLLLGFRFTEDDQSHKIDEVLKKVGLEGYGDRYPSELSGGEQQRIAVARALLKNSHVLLADEPTGNLDKKNGTEIYKLLKEIAQEKLVIIVSHDEDLGNQYADYIVHLQKGELIDNNMPKEQCDENYADTRKNVISNKIAIKMARHEYTYKKLRSISTTIVLAVCFYVLSVAISVLGFYHMGDIQYNLIKNQNWEHFVVQKVSYDQYLSWESKGIKSVLGDSTNLAFQSKAEAEANGIEFYQSDKTMELAPNNYYVSDAFLRELFRWGSADDKALIDGEEVHLRSGRYDYTDLIGQRIHILGYHKICAGVYHSPFPTSYYYNWVDKEYSNIEQYENAYYGQTISFISSTSGFSYPNISASYDNKTVTLYLGTYGTDLCKPTNDYSHVLVLNDDGSISLLEDNDMLYNSRLAEDEIYVSLSMYSEMFNTIVDESNILSTPTENATGNFALREMPQYLGTTVTLHSPASQEEIDENFGTYKIKGIVMYYMSSWQSVDWQSAPTGQTVFFSDKIQTTIHTMDLMKPSSQLWVTTNTVKNLKSFCRTNYNMDSVRGATGIVTPVNQKISALNIKVSNLQSTLSFVGIALVVVTFFTMGLLISGQIVARKREIGIFKALGARNTDIAKIYIFEMLFIVVPIIIASIILTAITISVLNFILVSDINTAFTLIYYQWESVPVTMLAITALVSVAVLIPLTKLNKHSIVSSIRDNSR